MSYGICPNIFLKSILFSPSVNSLSYKHFTHTPIDPDLFDLLKLDFIIQIDGKNRTGIRPQKWLSGNLPNRISQM